MRGGYHGAAWPGVGCAALASPAETNHGGVGPLSELMEGSERGMRGFKSIKGDKKWDKRKKKI